MLLESDKLNIVNKSLKKDKPAPKTKKGSSSTKPAPSGKAKASTSTQTASTSAKPKASKPASKPKDGTAKPSRSTRPSKSKATDPNWDESKHPRASDGRFGSVAGEHTKAEPKAPKKTTTKAAPKGAKKDDEKPKKAAGTAGNGGTGRKPAKRNPASEGSKPAKPAKAGAGTKAKGAEVSAEKPKRTRTGAGASKPAAGKEAVPAKSDAKPAKADKGKPPASEGGRTKGTVSKPAKSATADDKKPAKRAKPAVADVRTEGQKGNELAYDVGQEVWGSRKDLAQARAELNDKMQRGVSVTSTLAGLEKIDPGAAKKFCTKENILPKFDWLAQQKTGVDLKTAMTKKMIFDRIAPKPSADDPEVRRQYAYAIEQLHRILTPVKDFEELKSTIYNLRDRMNLELPKHWNDQERYLRYAEKKLAEPPTESDLKVRKPVGYDPKKGLIYEESMRTPKEVTAERQKRVDEIKAKMAQWQENAKNPYHVLGDKLTNFFTDADSANRTLATVQKKGANWEDFLDPQAKETAPKPKKDQIARWERKIDNPYYRSGGRKVKVEKPEDAVKQFGLRGVQFGHWVDDTSGKFHLLKAAEAFQDMADVLGMDDKDVALNGRLAIAFGARGTGGKDAAVAHYESALRVINMTKEKGAGSLAHEWGHALDDILGDHSEIMGFASEEPEKIKDPDIQQRFSLLMKAIYEGDGSHKGTYTVPNQKKTFGSYYPTRRKAVQEHGLTPEVVKRFTDDINRDHARERETLEGTIRRLKELGYDPSSKEKTLRGLATKYKKRMNEMHQELMYHHYRHTGEHVDGLQVPQEGSEYYNRMRECDGGGKGYYATGREMFARVFESWMEHTLNEKGTKNHYLVSGTTEKGIDAYEKAGFTGAGLPPFPRGSEREHMFNHMTSLMRAIVNQGEIKKALESDLQKALFTADELREKGRKYAERLRKLADRDAEPVSGDTERNAYTIDHETDASEVLYIPVNRLKMVYQTDAATNWDKVKENMDKMRQGIGLKPVEIGYDYDVHDGHHRWIASKTLDYTHVPCIVKGKDEAERQDAIARYQELWKAIIPDPTGNSPFPEDGTLMFRGVGQRELNFIRENGYIQSKGKGNDDDKEDGETCFSNLFRQAEGYARSNYDLYGEEAAYVVVLPKHPLAEEDEHGELIMRGKVPAFLMTIIPIDRELRKSWDESKHPRDAAGRFGSGGVTLFHGTHLPSAEVIQKKGFKVNRSGTSDMGKCAYFKSPEWDDKEADDFGKTERTVNYFAEGEDGDRTPAVIKAMIPREHVLDCSKGRPEELQAMIDEKSWYGTGDKRKKGTPRWGKNDSPYEAYAKKHGIKAIIDKLDGRWQDEGYQLGVYDPSIIQILDVGKGVKGEGAAAELMKALASEAAYCLLHHEFDKDGHLHLHVGAIS